MKLTAGEYRTAAHVLREQYAGLTILVDTGALIDNLERLADDGEREKNYAIDLFMASTLCRYGDPAVRGKLILDKLQEDGWSPPEGLF